MSTNDESVLCLLDSTYEDSELIKSMKTTSKGFSAYTKVFSSQEIDNIVNLAEKKIDEAINNIVNGKFDINPKQIKFENVSCKYCKYKDLCFQTSNNVVLIEEGD